MGRVAKGKKNADSNVIAVEKKDDKKKTPTKQAISENVGEKSSEIEEPLPNFDAKVKTNTKSTKSAKDKKESNQENKNFAPKTNDQQENGLNEVSENKRKRPTKKKPEESTEEMTAPKKRSKKAPVMNENDENQENNVDKQDTENIKAETPKKRGRGAKSDEQSKTDVVEPVNKRVRKAVNSVAASNKDENKKPAKGKKAAVEAPKIDEVIEKPKKESKAKEKTSKKDENIEESSSKEPVARKGKNAKKDEQPESDNADVKHSITKKSKVKTTKKDQKQDKVEENPEVSEPVVKKGKGRTAKIVEKPDSDNTEVKKQTPEKPKGKASKKAENEDNIVDKKTTPKKGKAGKLGEQSVSEVDSAEVKPPTPKKVAEPKAKGRAGKKADGKQAGEKKLLNSIESDFSVVVDIEDKWNMKITMWNTSGLRSCVEKGCVEYFKHEKPDIICLNEIKCGTVDEIPEQMKLDGYHPYWNIEKGQPGVGILTKQMPIDVFYDIPNSDFSNEKRLLTAEYKKFYLVCCYVVNAGRGLKTLDKRLEWNKAFDEYIRELDKKKPVIIAGDMNVAHSEIDLANPKTNQKNAGFTKEEREGFTQLLSYGFVDTFRKLYPDQKDAYTFWSYMNNARAKNVGWRLDYFITSERLIDNVKDNVIRSTIKGSDHCPIVLFLDL